jgi:endonuclease/exonuclease/phosphatase family metal-dependent hydrolase
MQWFGSLIQNECFALHSPFPAGLLPSNLARIFLIVILFGVVSSSHALAQNADEPKTTVRIPAPQAGAIRVATFNVALNRKAAGDLARDLKNGDEQASKIAAIIQSVDPDILLVNELDYDEETAKLFLEKYLQVRQPDAPRVRSRGSNEQLSLTHFFAGPVNTGIDSGLDLNKNDRLHDSDDAWGYGAFPGQYGLAVYSKFPIAHDKIRTFQKFLWSDMPNALRPAIPSKTGGAPTPFHSDEVWSKLRLSSKSHWDVPIDVNGREFHVIASHPTPPVFDGPEDRNGCRNHDEIRLLQDYIGGGDRGAYLVDDQGRKGPIESRVPFVILGDLNSDPEDGDGLASAIRNLINDKWIAKYEAPRSMGAIEASQKSGQANTKHRGDPASDTGDFNDKSPGNLRVDFVLPSANCAVVKSGIFWPSTDEGQTLNALAEASDHRLVWVDIVLP